MGNQQRLACALSLLCLATCLAGTNAAAEETFEVLSAGNGNYSNEGRFISHLESMTGGGYGVEVSTIKDYQVGATTDLTGYDLIVLTGFAPNVSTAGLDKIEDSELPILIISYWNFSYAQRLGLTSGGSGYVGASTLEMVTNEHPVTAFFEETEQVYTTSYTVYGVEADALEDGVTPLVYSSTSFDEIAVLSDDERKIAATGVYDASRFTAAGWELFDSLVRHLLPLERVARRESEVFLSLKRSGLVDLIEDVSEQRWLWTPEQAEATLRARLRVSGAPWIGNHMVDFLRRVFDDDEHFLFTYAPGECFFGHCVLHGDSCTSSTDCDEILASITTWRCVPYTPGEVGAPQDCLTSSDPACYEHCEDQKTSCLAWQEEIEDETDGRLPLPPVVEYDSTQFGGFPVLRVDGLKNNPIVTDPTSTTRLAISMYSTEPVWLIGLSDVTIPQIFTDFDKTTSLGRFPTFPTYEPWISAGSSRLLEASDFSSHQGGDVLFWRGNYTNAMVPHEMRREAYDPFMAQRLSAKLTSDANPSVVPTGTTGQHVFSLDLFRFTGQIPQERGSMRHQECSYRAFLHPYADGAADSIANHLKAFTPDPWPLACKPNEGICDKVCPLTDPGCETQSSIALRNDQDDCTYDASTAYPFNPFADGGLPNTFADAVLPAEPDSSVFPPLIPDPETLLPRVQLVWPSNPWLSRFHFIESFCESFPYICSNLPATCDVPESVADDDPRLGLLKAFLGLVDGEDGSSPETWRYVDNETFCKVFDPRTLTKRQRGPKEVPWSSQRDRGPWQKPRLTAGFWVPVVATIRQEDDSLPLGIATAYCDPDEQTSATKVMLVQDQVELTNADLVCAPVYNPSTAGGGVATTYGWESPIEVGTGITLMTEQFEEDQGERLLKVPATARGPAELVIRATVTLMDENGIRYPDLIERRFPVYIDAADARVVLDTEESTVIGPSFTDLATVRDSVPLSWIGSSLNAFRKIDAVTPATTLPAAMPECAGAAGQKKCAWLAGGDEGPWLLRTKKVRGEETQTQLHALFGDVAADLSTSALSVHYSGAGMAAFIERNGSSFLFEEPGWLGGHNYPRMTMEGVKRTFSADDPTYTTGFEKPPWDILPKGGAQVLRGFYTQDGAHPRSEYGLNWVHPVVGTVSSCSTSKEATVAPVTGFQFADQHDSGDAYIWFGVATDWGMRNSPGMGNPEDGSEDPLTGMDLAAVYYDYDHQLTEPWSSKLGVWRYKEGHVEDFGGTVAWPYLPEPREDTDPIDVIGGPVSSEGASADTTLFVIVAAVAVEQLQDHIPNGGATGPGVLLWHAGRYRNSPVYFSWAKRDDVQYPGRYRHFAGYSISGTGVLSPKWTREEAYSMPVLLDTVGEISAVVVPHDSSASCTGATSDCVLEEYKLLYNINSAGQQGIVLRTADSPWGPFGDQIPLFDCTHTAHDMRQPEAKQGPELVIQGQDWLPMKKRFQAGVFACYGGFTHPELWKRQPDQNRIRFNISAGFNPYKVFLAETFVPKAVR